MIDKTSLTQAIKEKANDLGFQLGGVATPDPPTHLEIFFNWLSQGHHAEMNWMNTDRARERRADPRKILPGCKSILMLGVLYPPHNAANEENRQGKVASYAWGDDYHDVLPKKMQAIVAFIENLIGGPVPNRWYTDTGPILERELAQRAGLGWIGKNSCLINPKLGSFFLLAEILLGIELEIDDPHLTDHCGTCSRCLEFCPTSCIMPDRTIDANRCISYLTIEHRGSIPKNLRADLQDWVFGCDICQQVCPWNQKFAPQTLEPAFEPRPGLPHPNLEDELALTPQAFNRKFKGNPVKRTKRRGYLRNICVAAGNSSSIDFVPSLVQALKDEEPLICSHAAWALGQIGGKTALHALLAAGESQKDPDVLFEIRSALQFIQSSME